MAKQTFTTGQVLTAAQMTSLQQTAMGGGSTTAKTVSYTLVAADAGTVVQMNSASATTITVNTALFAAGDTVQIQNIGAGVCTVTAGTATVSTAGSLALSQYEGGQLYFTAASASIFFDVVQASSTSKVVQIVNTQTGATATGTTVLPNDGTIPQITEGTQFMTLAITPTSASNILDITVSMLFQCGVNLGDIGVALFQDTTANALACTAKRMAASTPDNAVLTFRMTAGTTSATTFRVRMGNADSGTQTFNSNSYGNVVASSITITESTP